MTPIDIRIELLRKDYTAARLASELGITRSTVSNVINGYGYSTRVARAISRVTHVPIHRLFPRPATRAAGSLKKRRSASLRNSQP